MGNDRTTPLLLAFVILTPLAGAGSSANPELTDPAGDAMSAVDVTAAWLSTDSKYLNITLKLSDLGVGSPLATGHSRYVYQAAFAVDATRVVVEGGVSLVDTTGVFGLGCAQAGVILCVGTTNEVPARSARGLTWLDLSQDTVTIGIQRANGFTGLKIPSGAVISELTITTYTGGTPVEIDISQVFTDRLLDKADTTGVANAYFVP